MTRPLRLEFPGALYHVTSRGNRQGAIFLNDNDRFAWLDVLGNVCARCHLVVHAYCQMGNHYHLLVETIEGNLSQGMQQLNASYTQNFNRRHGMVGHVFQGRYKAILVQKESYLLELARYVVLNPVRAGMVTSPRDWKWSSYRCTSGDREGPAWLATAWMLDQFGDIREQAVLSYRQFVMAGIGAASPLKAVKHQLLLGDETFAAQHAQAYSHVKLVSVAKVQRRASSVTLLEYQQQYRLRDEAMARAYWSTAFSMAEIGAHFGVGYSTVSRAVKHYADEALEWHHKSRPTEEVIAATELTKP
ncbi:MAG: transposase [Telluria sp.]